MKANIFGPHQWTTCMNILIGRFSTSGLRICFVNYLIKIKLFYSFREYFFLFNFFNAEVFLSEFDVPSNTSDFTQLLD